MITRRHRYHTGTVWLTSGSWYLRFQMDVKGKCKQVVRLGRGRTTRTTRKHGFHLEVDSWADPSGRGAYATRPDGNGTITYPKTHLSNAPGNVFGIQWLIASVLAMPLAGYFGNEGVGRLLDRVCTTKTHG